MPVTNAGLYQVILEQTLKAQSLINTFWYLHNLGSDDEQDLCAQAFDEDILPLMDPIATGQLTYDVVRVKNVTGLLADHVLTPTTTVGTLAGTPLPTFNAAAIRLNRTTKETRNGQKRFAGATEEVASGQDWTAAYITTLTALAAGLVADISTVGGIFEPVIVNVNTAGPSPVYTTNAVLSATVSQWVTSQVSRKRGVGE